MGANISKLAQGPARRIGGDIADTCTEFSNPDLHRHIAEPATLDSSELDKSYALGVYGVDSYRTTRTNYRNEDPEDEVVDTEEIP